MLVDRQAYPQVGRKHKPFHREVAINGDNAYVVSLLLAWGWVSRCCVILVHLRIT